MSSEAKKVADRAYYAANREAIRAAQNAYAKTDKGIAARKRAQAKYEATEKGRENHARYRATTKGILARMREDLALSYRRKEELEAERSG